MVHWPGFQERQNLELVFQQGSGVMLEQEDGIGRECLEVLGVEAVDVVCGRYDSDDDYRKEEVVWCNLELGSCEIALQ